MNEIRIGTKEEQTAFRPGEPIEGAIGWNLAEPCKQIRVRLLWHTRGKGTEDVTVASELEFEEPPLQGAQGFQFIAPLEPYSFSGKLISVVWVLEAKASKGPSAHKQIVIAPAGKEIILGEPPAE